MRTVRVLHVEDNEDQQHLIAAHLAQLPDFAFQVTAVASEDDAVRRFPSGFGLVILDYQLENGDGLSCVRRLRMQDPIVPIIAVAGSAVPETAAALLKAGADDFISKRELSTENLGQSLRSALVRSDGLRERAAKRQSTHDLMRGFCTELCDAFLAGNPSRWLQRLDEFETVVRMKKLNGLQIQALFEKASQDRPSSVPSKDGSPVSPVLRPLLLEVLYRLSGQEALGSKP
jgi:CheY-like chemotaxis protein